MILITFYSAENLGDDMFVLQICNSYKSKQFFLYCQHEYSNAFRNVQNLKLIYNIDEISKYHHLIELQVLVGGSLFMQPQNESDIYQKFIYNKHYRYFMDKPFIIVGTNFGPYNKQIHYKLHKKWFSTLEHIVFRDKFSYNLFKDLKNVSYAPDMLFSFQLPSIEHNHSVGISSINDNGRIGLPVYNEKKYIEFLSLLCNEYICKGFIINLYSFCNKQKDNLAMEKIFNNVIEKNKINMIEYRGNVNTFLMSFLSNEFIIGTRFHSIVLALNAEIPVFPIIYNIKTKNLLNDLNYWGHTGTIIECDKIDFQFVDFNRTLTNKILPEIRTYSLDHVNCLADYFEGTD